MFASPVTKPQARTAARSIQRAMSRQRVAARPLASLGNQAILRRLGNGSAAEAGLGLPANITVGRVDDPLEHEADQVADRVMRMTSPEARHSAGCACCAGGSQAGTIRRKGLNGGSCSSAPKEDQAQQQQGQAGGGGPSGPQQDEKDTATAMAKATPGAASPAAPVATPLTAGSGRPLSAETRSFMEPRFGHSFGSVRVHADGEADALSGALSAEAFTLGSDVYFRAGRFQPSTETGKRLLAHELAHVVQQGDGAADGRIRRFTLNGFSPTQEAAMKAAIPKGSATMRSCTGTTLNGSIAGKIDSATYNFDANLGACGYSWPVPWSKIDIGPGAFDMKTCCKLESTLAHEASHTRGFVESSARKLECDCFSCCV
ncbi:MAG TPA: DUF4157 domain-containing protein [Stellaceae bacterium]|nr:DUF4157 domain-containing protein [Stellaceae bacterium]